MNIHEYQAKELLAKYGIAIPAGHAALTVETLSNLAPEQDRKNVILEGDLDEQIDGLVDALIKEGALGR